MIYELSVSQSIPFIQEIDTKPYMAYINTHFVFNQTIHHNIRTRKPVSQLSLSQVIGVDLSIRNLTVTSDLIFYQLAQKTPIYENIIHGLPLFQQVQQPKWEQLTSFINLSDAWVGNDTLSVEDTLNFVQTITGNCNRSPIIIQTLNLNNGIVGYPDTADFNFLYPGVCNPYTTVPKVRFSCGSTAFYVRKPDFDDAYRFDFTRINRKTRGGDLIISRDGIWPKTKTLNLHFSALLQQDVDNFLNFFKISLGKLCRYLNYDNVEWEGFILNPQTPVTQISGDNFTIAIEFEGNPV